MKYHVEMNITVDSDLDSTELEEMLKDLINESGSGEDITVDSISVN